MNHSVQDSAAAEEQLKEYVIKRRLDVSVFGGVYLCYHRLTDQLVAIKKISLQYAAQRMTVNTRQKVRESIEFEVGVHRSLRNNRSIKPGRENILQMLDTFEHGGFLYVIYEYCERGDLFSLIRNSVNERFSNSVALNIFKHVAQGIEFLHSCGYAHRDLSPKNVLITGKGISKICDFGLACYARASCCDSLDRTFYMAPEVSSGDTYYDPVKADIWSLGMLLITMLTGLPSSESATRSNDRLRVIVNNGAYSLIKKLKLKNHIPQLTIDLLDKILCSDPLKRISIRQILDHPLLSNNTSKNTAPITGTGEVVLLPIQLNGRDNFTAMALQTIVRKRFG